MQIIQPITEDQWWDVCRKCDYATFFHTPLWQKLVLTTYPQYQEASFAVKLDNGVLAVFPLLEARDIKGIGKTLYSSFAGCYGGLIADGALTDETRQAVYEPLRSRGVPRIQITSNPLHQEPVEIQGFSRTADFTQILQLDSTFDEAFRNFSKGHRSSYRRGIKLNVAVRVATTMDDYDAYYGAYEDSLRRWGAEATTRYPRALFENGYHLSEEHPENIKLWLAELDGQVIGGAWVFYWNHHADNWHAAAYEDFFDHYPNNVLHTEIIRDSIERGYRYYDFNPSGGFENVARFKGRFGAEKWPLTRWRFEADILRIARKISRALS